MTRRIRLFAAAVLAIGACSDVQDPNGNSNPESELAKSSATKPINVVLKGEATSAQLAELAKYGTVLKQIPKIKAVIMSGKGSNLAAIRARPFVAAANFDAERNIPPNVALPFSDFTDGLNTWNLDAINVTLNIATPDRQVDFDGTDVYVAILDTGLLHNWRHYFPTDRIAAQLARSFGGGGNARGSVSEQPNKWERDTHSHGTHVTSTVIGYQFGPNKINGVAPKATIIPVKVLNQNGSGWSSVIAEGITYIGDLKAPGGPLHGNPVVINMSLGGPILDAVEQAAIDYAIAQGVIIVASAGNSGEEGMGFPGAYPPVISVAASGWIGEWTCNTTTTVFGNWWVGLPLLQCDVPEENIADHSYITDFSSRELEDQELDVAAPGSWVLGPFELSHGQLSYFFLGGTSMASPHVAGIAALMADKSPGLTPALAQTILKDTAIPLGPGEATIFDPITGTFVDVSWGADATGEGLATADQALAGL